MHSGNALNILVAGIYRSGSSAIVDYLKGHPDVAAPEGEFTEFKNVGRIGHMLNASSPAEARRIANRITWETRLARLPRAWLRERKGGANLPLKYRVDQNLMKLRALKHYRQELAKGGDHRNATHLHNWMQEINRSCTGAGQKALLLNQPIWIGTHNEVWPQVFDPFKLIVVHRDPADQFADIVRQGTLGKKRSDPLYEGDNNQEDPIGYLLAGLTRKYEALHALADQLPGDRFLAMPFERFVLDHENAARTVCDYLGLEVKQSAERRFFPEQSRRNIGIGSDKETRQLLAPHQGAFEQLVALRNKLDDRLTP